MPEICTMISVLLIVLVLYFFLRYHWSKIDLYCFANSLDGPPRVLMIGNILEFMGNPEDFLSRSRNLLEQYKRPMRLWYGERLIVFFKNPMQVEHILESNQITQKDNNYDYLKSYFGNGLLTSSGSQWQLHRKIISSLFDTNFIANGTNVIQNNANILVNKMQNYANKSDFDVAHIVRYCYIDIISELVVGINLNSQSGQNAEFVDAVLEIYQLAHKRFMKWCVHSDFIYRWTRDGIRERKINRIVDLKIRNEVLRQSHHKEDFLPIDNSNENSVLKKMLEVLAEDPTVINEQDLVHHIFTLYATGEDTMSTVTNFALVMLGMHQNVQKRVAEELRSIFGNTSRPIQYEDLSKLNYLDMCIKETLRLFPVTPFIVRKCTDDFKFGEGWIYYTVPKGCSLVIPTFSVHRDPEQWERPEEFYPDHFLPEAVNKRHPYSFIPFSGGARSCIGKLFACATIKIVIASILQRYTIEADGKLSDIKLKTDISVRPVNGYKIRLKRRL